MIKLLNFRGRKNISLLVFLALSISLIVSCSSGPYPGYEMTENGLYYKIIEDNDTEVSTKGDYLKVNIQYRTMSDSVFFDSGEEVLPVWILVGKPMFHGDIMEGINMLSEGDSASFIVRIDTFYLMTIGAIRIPDLGEDSMMYVNMRVLERKTKEEFDLERDILDQQTQVELEELRLKEMEDLKEYIKANNIREQPRESGLIFIPIQNGDGINPKDGQTVVCHYTGSFVDGQVFDSSVGIEPLHAVIGSGEFIDGFDEALRLMSKGGKAKAIIPSDIGFGKSDINFHIPPYATLVFEIEILDVID
ncbi:MAG: FKBP-type peptidyl-prolyl cis-trans isomerase [Bacteroidales bacterium]|nr:FKBP-type peptidyl-prolyl cis-trans isomerase [Bacteroidales bacterium]